MLAIEQMASSFDAGYLNLFLLPTERCNFRCTYCYEDFNIGRMRPAVSAGVKALIQITIKLSLRSRFQSPSRVRALLQIQRRAPLQPAA